MTYQLPPLPQVSKSGMFRPNSDWVTSTVLREMVAPGTNGDNASSVGLEIYRMGGYRIFRNADRNLEGDGSLHAGQAGFLYPRDMLDEIVQIASQMDVSISRATQVWRWLTEIEPEQLPRSLRERCAPIVG